MANLIFFNLKSQLNIHSGSLKLSLEQLHSLYNKKATPKLTPKWLFKTNPGIVSSITQRK